MAGDTSSAYGMAKFLLPKVPSVLKAVGLHSLNMLPTSSKWDLDTTIRVSVLRSLMGVDSSGPRRPASVAKIQAQTLADPGVKGKRWAARTEIPGDSVVNREGEGGEGVVDVVVGAIGELGDGKEEYTRPTVAPIAAEWIGHRADAKDDEPQPDLTASETYERLMAEPSRKSKTTILYFHGGAYYMCGFGTHREPITRLVKACNGRALAIEYRLAPQAAFPSQLVDALNAYLYLQYPPEGSLHTAVPASDIVFAGDSAGGNLSFALLQLLLQLQRSKPASSPNPVVSYHGKQVPVLLPAGVSALSGWFDICRALPSIASNAKYDYLPPADHDDLTSSFAQDSIWPTQPPRGDLFCDLSLLCHPLASPVAAPNWEGSPPLWIMTGEELLTDEDSVLAVRAAEQGVAVQWEQYEAMPHCFSMLLAKLETSRRCYRSWGEWSRLCVEQPHAAKTNGTWIPAKGGELEEREVEVKSVTTLQWEDAVKMMREAQKRRFLGFEKEGKTMPKPNI